MSLRFLLNIVIAIVVVGAMVYLVDLLPIDSAFKLVAKAIAIIVLVVWLLIELREIVSQKNKEAT